MEQILIRIDRRKLSEVFWTSSICKQRNESPEQASDLLKVTQHICSTAWTLQLFAPGPSLLLSTKVCALDMVSCRRGKNTDSTAAKARSPYGVFLPFLVGGYLYTNSCSICLGPCQAHLFPAFPTKLTVVRAVVIVLEVVTILLVVVAVVVGVIMVPRVVMTTHD